MKIGLITNTRSRRNRRGPPRVPGAHSRGVEVLHRPLDGVASLGEVLDDFARAEVGVIAINGGDGTISATLTELMEYPRFETVPSLALLRGGDLNMSAANLGLKGSAERALARLVDRAARPDFSDALYGRETIRLKYSDDKRPVYGLFFGTAAIYRSVVLCRQRVHAMSLHSSLAAGATLAYVLARHLFRRGTDDALIRGDEMTVQFNGGPGEKVTQFLALVTTLDRLILRSRPFWGQEAGVLRYTGVAYPSNQLGRSVYRLLYGGRDRRLPQPEFMSCNADSIAFAMNCPFTLDGELFEPEPGILVELSKGGRLRFVRC